MKTNAYIAGVGMTPFGNHMGTPLRELGARAIRMALEDAGIEGADLDAAYMANGGGALIVGQGLIAGQVALRHAGIGKIPVINVENACASSSTAAYQAAAMITAGLHDVVLVCGFDKLYHEDKARTFAVFAAGVDVEQEGGLEAELEKIAEHEGVAIDDTPGAGRSAFMDIYALSALVHMKKYGTTQQQFAAVSAKNSYHGSLNPNAQFQQELSVEDVLASREIVYPLTLPMCSPVGDGAAALVLVSERKARELGLKQPVRMASSVLASGWDHDSDEPTLLEHCAKTAYAEAGVSPGDLSCVELHDASAPSEIIAYEKLGLCDEGKGGELVASGATRLGGHIPVNTSGGLLRKGHPIGATGAAQLIELTLQLQGRAGKRQVPDARVGLAYNGGGNIGTDAAATVVTILEKKDL
ncbi:thiolase family protein [Microbulbifer hainanensis]|uniref:thiolase family protein n=1 Tax=Microbulbifer hainanensis TaxID=2735675 RepID=UPI00186684BC|nr:thiolase family protein [Microbulbifer hainanensis]